VYWPLHCRRRALVTVFAGPIYAVFFITWAVIVASFAAVRRHREDDITRLNRELAKRAADRIHELELELAHANPVATMGLLTASIAHEINQPITGTVASADAALRWLDTQPPDMKEVRHALDLIMEAGVRAAEVIDRIRALVSKAPPRKDWVDITAAIREVIALTKGEIVKNSVSVQTRLAEGLPFVQGDRVQLQQVLLNLIINAVEAMSGTSEGQRELLISTEKLESGIAVMMQDSGPGLSPATVGRVFESFHTTKPGGLGLGLSICRSIIEAHRGRLWATNNVRQGPLFISRCRHTHSSGARDLGLSLSIRPRSRAISLLSTSRNSAPRTRSAAGVSRNH
jgi:C4-dicarboxylate-specific signal transduction histidine kinase